MQTQEIEVLQHLKDWCDSGQHPWLCTIVAAAGSSPRPIGAMMACLEDGRQAGSVSGGCVEEDLLTRLRAGEFDDRTPTLLDYGISATENERLGLPCGGRLKLLLQKLDSTDLAWLEEVLCALQARRCIERLVTLEAGNTQLVEVDHFTTLQLDETRLRQCFGPGMRMLLVGAGQLASSLAELALAMDYQVLVTDPRPEVLQRWEGPELPLIQGMPDDVLREHASDRFSVIITLTHDPRIDDMALMEALGTEACYVGALGSARATDKRLQRLRELGLPDEHIARLHAPVGLPIGSKTPIEIAVAIMAELTRLRRLGTEQVAG